MILKVSTQYKKDLKRYQNKLSKIAALKKVLKHLKKMGLYLPSINHIHFRANSKAF